MGKTRHEPRLTEPLSSSPRDRGWLRRCRTDVLLPSSVTFKITRGKGCLIFRPFTLALEPNNTSSKPYMFFQACPLFVFFLSFFFPFSFLYL